jgi:hypothetical protein
LLTCGRTAASVYALSKLRQVMALRSVQLVILDKSANAREVCRVPSTPLTGMSLILCLKIEASCCGHRTMALRRPPHKPDLTGRPAALKCHRKVSEKRAEYVHYFGHICDWGYTFDLWSLYYDVSASHSPSKLRGRKYEL